jgi:hypothetical protein
MAKLAQLIEAATEIENAADKLKATIREMAGEGSLGEDLVEHLSICADRAAVVRRALALAEKLAGAR